MRERDLKSMLIFGAGSETSSVKNRGAGKVYADNTGESLPNACR